jgi:hypothetical protein
MSTTHRIVSKRVHSEIPQWTQNMLWYLVESLDIDHKEDVQRFELSSVSADDIIKKKIVHTQHQPPYSMEYIVSASLQPVNAKVLIVDCSTHLVMLLY